MHVGIWGFAAVVVLLLAAHCSVSLCPSRFMGLLFSLGEQCYEIYVLGHKLFSGYKLGWIIPVRVVLPSARRFYIPKSRIIVIQGYLLIFYEECKKRWGFNCLTASHQTLVKFVELAIKYLSRKLWPKGYILNVPIPINQVCFSSKILVTEAFITVSKSIESFYAQTK